MELDVSPERKLEISHNTYLLALDGDIDFQPHAVQLLIGRMKVNPDLGAACGRFKRISKLFYFCFQRYLNLGRIHPVGSGPMVFSFLNFS